MNNSASEVFVSYKAEDRPRLAPLVKALETEGITVWWDAHIGGGANWREEIQQHLDGARCVIVAWSKRSVGPEGQFVCDEAARAKKAGSYVPIKIDEVNPPLGFGGVQALSFVGWKGKRRDPRFRALVSAVRTHLESEEPLFRGMAVAQPKVSRRTAIAGGVGALAVAGVGGWALLKPGGAAASNRIAVMSFSNMSGDPGQAYFSDGIAEELRGALSRVGMQVIGKASCDSVKDMAIPAAAAKLGVSHILTGSVRRSTETIRVGAQLVNGEDGVEKWAQNYDRAPGDTIKIQTDIAESVARALSITLGTAARRAITVGGTEKPAAQRLLFQALEAGRRSDKQALQQAVSLADEAIRLDPKYADAQAHKALFTIYYAGTYAKDASELFRMRADAMQTVNVALGLAPDLASAHGALAEIHRALLELGPALGEYRRALKLAPGDAETLANYALVIGALGNAGEAIRLADQAIKLDPLNVGTYNTRFKALMVARRYEEAVQFSQELERTQPQLFNWPEFVAYVLIIQNKLAEAETYQQKAQADNYDRLVNEAAIFARTGKRDQIPGIVDTLRKFYGDAASFQYGQIYAQSGDKDLAFAAFDRAFAIRDSGLIRLRTDPYVEPLRSDPRYAALLTKLDFPA